MNGNFRKHGNEGHDNYVKYIILPRRQGADQAIIGHNKLFHMTTGSELWIGVHVPICIATNSAL